MYLPSNGLFCAIRSQNTREIIRKLLKKRAKGIAQELNYVLKRNQASIFYCWAEKGTEGLFMK